MRQKTNNRTFLFLKRTALWCAAGLLGLQSAQALEVERLRTEAVKNPVGIDVEKPMFSWRMDAGDERGVKQTAYEIAVFSDASCTEQVWTSGRVESDRQIDVAYEGDKLQPSTRYYWTVTVWDNKGGESTSTEKAYFETGLMGGGWNGARWIQATDTPLTSEEEGIHHYSVEADFEVDNISTGVIFAANEDQSHYYMWQINFETGYARLRPHVYRGDQQFATCLEEIDLRPLIDLQLHQTYHLRIEVDGQTAYTYIDDVLVDTRTNPDGGNYGYGNIGVWEYGSERAYFDNIVVTDLGGETPETLISEDFSDSSNPFTSGTITEGRLLVNTASWYKAESGDEDTDITRYTIETDFEIDNLSAGIIFGANEAHSHYYMWQINLEAGYPRLRPHVWRGPNLADATCLAEIDLRPLVNVQLHQTYRLRIEVNGSVARTYIDDILVDTRNEPDGGIYGYGQIGIRQDRALNEYSDTERAYFDNFTVTSLDGDAPEVLISEDFSDDANPFTAGQIQDGRLFIEASYSWYVVPGTSNLAYDVELDFIVERDNAGIIFSGYDTNNFHMWGINIRDKATPFLRRHVKTNGSFATSDADLGAFFSKADLTNSLHHLKISVRGNVVQTYIDGQLVDTYSDTSGRLVNGLVGFRAYYDRTMNETAYYDNIKVTTYNDTEDTQGTVTFSEDFEGAGMAFSDGTAVVKEGSKMLCVQSTYDETCSMQTGKEKGMPLFRKAFTTKGAVKSAKIYASALGVFDLFLNGKRVGVDGSDIYDELKPGWTDYRKEINYMTYDVTPLMREGGNVIGAQVSNGWWAGAIARSMYGSNPTLGFIAQLRIEYEDGTVEHVVTDTDWSCSYYGPLILGDIYNGETYDARRESDWSSPEYDASGWNFTAENTEFHGEITAFRGQTVRVRDEFRLTPKTITVYEGAKPTGTTYGEINVTRTLSGTEQLQLKAGETALVDLGQNMTGWIRFTAKGQSGTNLRVKFGEMLNDNGASDRLNDGPGGSLYTYNLRTAEATLHYTLRGAEDGETFQPSTTFFGFRYCEITTSSDVEISQLTGEFVGSDLEEHATFETSHPDVNQLYSNIRWSQRDNFLSVPTDCPQRDERLGWTGDIQVFARAATYHADTRAFLRKWLGDLRQSQREDGAYPDIAPFPNFWGFGTGGWGDAGVIVPWTVYLMTGDQAVLEECYASMTHYMDWLSLQGDGQYKYNGAGTSTGDWLSYENTDSRYVCVCHYANVAQLMSKIAGALNQSPTDTYYADSLKYEELYDNIRAEWQTRYLDGNGQPTVSTQTSYLMALKFGLLPETSVERAREILREKIENNGYKLSTGFIGTSILNQTLSEQGMDDLAYDLLLQRENPSWLYSVDQGATTIWERWDSYTKESGFNKHEWNMNSFNHYSYGVVSEWMFRRVAGIEADEAQPGFKHFFLMPTPDDRTYFPAGQERITSVKATHESGYGLIRSEWQRTDDGRVSYKATVPANSTATLYLPVLSGNDEITEGGKALEEAEGVTFKGIEDGKAVIGLESGSYEFTTEEGKSDHVEEAAYKSFRIHPNPFHDMLNINCGETVRQVSVTAGNGQTVCIQNHGRSINTSAWTPGLYIVQVDTAEGRYCTKAIKE